MATKVLSSDILIADMMIPPLETKLAATSDPALQERLRERYAALDEKLDAILARKGVKRGQKVALNREEFEDLSKLVSGINGGIEPGGSSANTLTTLSKLLGKRLEVDFLGVAGTGLYSTQIRNGLEEANIRLLPEIIEGQAPEAALSFVFQTPDGSRTIATYPGNARSILKPEHITEELIRKNDVMFVQGSLFEKFDKGFADKLVTDRWQADKEIWLALPTHAKFSEQMSPKAYRYLIPSADVVLGNDEELMRIYQASDRGDAIRELQYDLARRDEIKAIEHKHSRREATAFITCDKEGAYAVTANSIEKVDACEQEPGKRIYKLGAGDASFAGFLAGYVAGLPPKAAAQLGMEVASAKLGHDSARIPDPRKSLKRQSATARALLEKVDHNLDIHHTNGKRIMMGGVRR